MVFAARFTISVLSTITVTQFEMNVLIRSILALLFSSTLILIFINKKFDIKILTGSSGKVLDPDENDNEDYFSEIKISIILLFSVYILSLFIPQRMNIVTIPIEPFYSFFSLILSHSLIIAYLFSLYVIWKWQRKRRSKNSDSYFISIVVLSLLAILENVVSDVFLELRIGIFEAVYVLVLILLALASYLYTSRTTWIALLDRNKKIKLALFSFIQLIVIVFLVSSTADGSALGDTLNHFMPGGVGLAFVFSFIMIPHYFRILINSLITLPTSEVVERKSSELSSLTYLNKVVAETKDFEKILSVVNELALRSTGAFASWTEIYEDDEMRIAGLKNLTEVHVNSINSIPHLRDYLLSFKRPFLVESIKKNQICKDIKKILPVANSLIFVPLFDQNKRFGTVVLLHISEYGLEENDLKVLTAFSDNVSIALENSRLLKDSLENERYKNEMQIARDMQVRLLPQDLVQVDGYSIAAFSVPAEEVGGDYYDNFELKDGRQCFIVGDVSGKGTGSALFMAQVKGVAMSLASTCTSGKEFLQKINDTLYGTIENKLYITMGCLVIDNKQKKVTYSRAGHMPLIHKSSEKVDFIKPKGLGIGLVSAKQFDRLLEEVELDVSENDIFVVFTDGVNELRNRDGIEYGYQSIQFLLEKYKYSDARNFNVKLRNSLSNYGKGVHQHDDLTVLTVMAK